MEARSLRWAAVVPALLFLAGCGSAPLLDQSDSGRKAEPRLIEAHPPIHVKGPDKKPAPVPSSPIGYTPPQMRAAYGITGDGAGQTIAIVDAYGSPTIASDVAKFSDQFGLPACDLKIVAPRGKIRTNAGWALETSLDVEWAHAIAPGATILLVVAKTAYLSDLLAAVDTAVQQGQVLTGHPVAAVSMSWGAGEFLGESSYDSHFSAPGISFTASSGDSGAGVSWPAVSPNVIGVGGTSLTLGADGTWMGETAWSGSGGGQSAYVTTPSWQSGPMRQVPDVAYNADPNTGVAVYDSTSYNGQKGWFQVGGTSAGAPQWAAICALAKADALTAGYVQNLGLYGLQSTGFHDITSGSNGYPALPGYDMVTGIGSPKANNLIPGL